MNYATPAVCVNYFDYAEILTGQPERIMFLKKQDSVTRSV